MLKSSYDPTLATGAHPGCPAPTTTRLASRLGHRDTVGTSPWPPPMGSATASLWEIRWGRAIGCFGCFGCFGTLAQWVGKAVAIYPTTPFAKSSGLQCNATNKPEIQHRSGVLERNVFNTVGLEPLETLEAFVVECYPAFAMPWHFFGHLRWTQLLSNHLPCRQSSLSVQSPQQL
jgi:hypothetical protein